MPIPVVRRGEAKLHRCPYWQEGCDYADASGLRLMRHVQTRHVSRNEALGPVWHRSVGDPADVRTTATKLARRVA